ncbi:Gfo/Idh/MocA family oxidoreductase [Pseudosulfitobacter sp. DSM 107133]|uniref:Gfo/Idh/MocA family protein n=1 Tax=Pseudosulfitobacter sp. DSM 107133 TaxID=2883100 RepID=UPI000DF41A8B|nr:Gfo/Idh/MocA family oxidoreductase [Pseudosulfitobacter sp. DSM 107133]UOA29169.1 L-arabinose 1-dehydrogenase (NAD(P)(+)) [Pseudosulfitobacter sp. DSM 107133]
MSVSDLAADLAIVGVGKIARDQHIPSIAATPAFALKATASRNSGVDGVPRFEHLEDLLDAHPEISCISLCTPPQVRYDDARRALLAGRHVMLEKPPGATLSEVHDLIALARAQGVALFATWHSRHAASVQAARKWLQDKDITRVEVIWKEDVRRWHPGQDWIWQAGGLGVFDPGINALSVLSEIYPRAVHLTQADLFFPENRDTPIAADLTFNDPCGAEMTAAFDWRQTGPQTWDIRIETAQGTATLSDGGANLSVDGEKVNGGPDHEYRALYARFAELVERREIDVDLRPMLHVSDAFTLGRRQAVAAFDW